MTEIIAGTLLILRLVAVHYLFRVLKIQIRLLRRPIDPCIWDFRRKLHYMTVALLLGNVLPIILDSLVVLRGFGVLEFVRTSPLLITYAISNALIGFIAATLIYRIYKLANEDDDIVDDLEKRSVIGHTKK